MNGQGIFKTFYYDSLKHLFNLCFHPEYRRFNWLLTRYAGIPRFTKKKIRIHGWNLVVPDIASFLSAYREIFVEEIYAFQAENQCPVILDCGANIGLSILYFKLKFPDSKIFAFEADPQICQILRNNIKQNNIKGVEIENKAIWSSEMVVDFKGEGSDGGRIEHRSDKSCIKVPAVSLYSILQTQKYDFVKIDIEGAEWESLKNCKPVMKNLKYVFVEFHSFIETKQELGEMIDFFEQEGFRVHIHQEYIVKRPFLGIKETENGMDMQLNLFFWRAKINIV